MTTNYASGHAAEDYAINYLVGHGYSVTDKNWRTRYCEIDIIANKGKAIYFIEVKSRSSRSQGFGSDYITPKKLSQMRFAAELWVATHSWRGDYRLGVVSIDGGEITLIDDIILE